LLANSKEPKLDVPLQINSDQFVAPASNDEPPSVPVASPKQAAVPSAFGFAYPSLLMNSHAFKRPATPPHDFDAQKCAEDPISRTHHIRYGTKFG
jgi:hypothetical protein